MQKFFFSRIRNILNPKSKQKRNRFVSNTSKPKCNDKICETGNPYENENIQIWAIVSNGIKGKGVPHFEYVIETIGLLLFLVASCQLLQLLLYTFLQISCSFKVLIAFYVYQAFVSLFELNFIHSNTLSMEIFNFHRNYSC